VGNPLVRQLSRYLRWPRADASCLMRKLRDQLTTRVRMQNGGQVDVETCSLFTSWAHFDHPDWGFTVIFLRCKVNARVKLEKSGHRPRNPTPCGHSGFSKVPTSNTLCDLPPWVQLPGSHPTKVPPSPPLR
jgi:hypothetical protein